MEERYNSILNVSVLAILGYICIRSRLPIGPVGQQCSYLPTVNPGVNCYPTLFPKCNSDMHQECIESYGQESMQLHTLGTFGQNSNIASCVLVTVPSF